MTTKDSTEYGRDEAYGYVGRRRGCGCVVFICTDDAIRVENPTEALYAGLVLERWPIEEIRKTAKFGCKHGGEGIPEREGKSLWRCESFVIVAAEDEDEALAAAKDTRFDREDDARAVPVSPETLEHSHEVIVAGDDEHLYTTVRQWLTEEAAP